MATVYNTLDLKKSVDFNFWENLSLEDYEALHTAILLDCNNIIQSYKNVDENDSNIQAFKKSDALYLKNKLINHNLIDISTVASYEVKDCVKNLIASDFSYKAPGSDLFEDDGIYTFPNTINRLTNIVKNLSSK